MNITYLLPLLIFSVIVHGISRTTSKMEPVHGTWNHPWRLEWKHLSPLPWDGEFATVATEVERQSYGHGFQVAYVIFITWENVCMYIPLCFSKRTRWLYNFIVLVQCLQDCIWPGLLSLISVFQIFFILCKYLVSTTIVLDLRTQIS